MNKITQTKRMTASDFDQELLDLYDFYAHGKNHQARVSRPRREVRCWRADGDHFAVNAVAELRPCATSRRG